MIPSRWRILALVPAFALFAACGGGGGSASAPPAAPAPASPAPVASLPALSQNQRAAVDARAQALIASNAVPGISLAIGRGGVPYYLAQYGRRSIAAALPVDANTTFEIGSVTKQFTAACVLLLAQDGRLSIDDALTAYVPEYTTAAGVTLRQMLNMVSGVPGDVGVAFDDLYGPTPRAQVLARLAAHALDFAPGTQYEYSNLNYYLLGVVIERVSGTSYGAFVANRLFAPLGLGSMTYGPGTADVAQGYWHALDPANPLSEKPRWNLDYLFSMGSLSATPLDLLRWDADITSGGVLSVASTATMFTVPRLASGAPTKYAMGWYVEADGERWHDGQIAGFHAVNTIFPEGWQVVIEGNDWDTYPSAWSPESLALAIRTILAGT